MLSLPIDTSTFTTTTQIVIAVFFSITLWWILTVWQSSPYSSFRRIGKPWTLSLLQFKPVHDLVEDGYNKITKSLDEPFALNWWAKEYLIMPPKYLADLRGAEWDQLSFFQNISDALHLHSSVGDLYASDRMVQVVKRGLNPQLPRIIPLMADEIAYAFQAETGDCTNWKDFKATELLVGVAHRQASQILIGDELCRNEQFIKSSMKFVESIFVNALVIAKLPLGPFRSWLAWPLSFLHRRRLEKSLKILLPVVEKRIAERAASMKTSDRLDAIEWTLALSESEIEDEDPRRLALELLHNLWAGSSAPGGLVTEMLFQVLIEPDYLEPLRNEAQDAVSQYGWSEKMLNSLHLLDSFIKEINRLFPTGSVTCSRTVVEKPFKFTDGLILPVGSRFGFPIKAIQRDLENFKDPLKFDGYRFARLASANGRAGDNANSWGAATVSTTNLAFGYGNHVCPGRFLAVRQVKFIFSRLILDYDVKWDKPISERPPSFPIEGQFIPNLKQKISLKRRNV